MAQQPNQLVVVTERHQVIKALATPEICALLDQYLGGTPLTGKRLITDLAVQLSIKPSLLRCSLPSLFQCLTFAAQHKTTFGPYGVWIVSRDLKEDDKSQGAKIPTAMPQLSYKRKIQTAKEQGAFAVFSDVVLKGEPFVVHKDGGVITGIDFIKPTPLN